MAQNLDDKSKSQLLAVHQINCLSLIFLQTHARTHTRSLTFHLGKEIK